MALREMTRQRLENARQRLCRYRGARQRAHGSFLHGKVPLPRAFSKNTRLTIFAVRHARRTAKRLTDGGLTGTAAASHIVCRAPELSRTANRTKKKKKNNNGRGPPPAGHHRVGAAHRPPHRPPLLQYGKSFMIIIIIMNT
jgi:hypothetical protein